MTAPPRRAAQITGGTVHRAGTRLRVAGCPEPGCQAPAEIYDEVALSSTDGPIAHARTRCLNDHGFLLPVEYIPGWPPAGEPHRW
jgi:hypothetical protein